MDLRPLAAGPDSLERAAVDAVLGPMAAAGEVGGDGRVARAGRGARSRRHLLLPALWAVQDAVGCVPPGALGYVAERLAISPAEVHGVASFYDLLVLGDGPPGAVRVCDDVACRAALGGDPAAAWEGAAVAWERSGCLGRCDRAPAVLVQRAGSGRHELVASDATPGTAAGDLWPTPPATVTASLAEPLLLRRVGRVDPTDLDAYRAAGGYEALRRAIATGRDGVLAAVEASGLRGRGGAGFPTGTKWRAVARAARPAYVVGNADESEPGTFKDRVLLEEDPFAVVEGLTLAGFATGAERGFLYLRGEYPLAEERVASAIAAARAAGLLGADVMGAGFRFDVEVRRGAGAYVCGEETALLESIEGRRGEPRPRPPYPTQVGLFGRPTAVNNVETLAAAVAVVAGRPEAAAAKLFPCSGAVARPGVYEARVGVTIREILDAAGGGAPTAVLLGGAAGRFVADLDVALHPASDPPLGSGALVAFDDRIALDDVVLRIAAFFRHESCGRCVPCRIGTVRQEESLRRHLSGAEGPDRLGDLAAVLRDASLCGLGQSAATAIGSALALGLVGGERHG